jgi:hypothetical protein
MINSEFEFFKVSILIKYLFVPYQTSEIQIPWDEIINKMKI